MIHRLRWVAIAAVLILADTSPSLAQINIDTRGLGYGGWNQAPSPRTDGATGRSIDAQTAMNLNEYIFQSQQAANQRYAERLARRLKRVNETADSVLKRLRENPSKSDVTKGDALNVAFDDLTNPKLYAKTLEAAKSTPFAGTKIKAIPFQYASAAITTSIEDLTQTDTIPSVLKEPDFKTDLSALKKLEAEFKANAEAEKTQGIRTERVNEAKKHIKAMSDRLKKNPTKVQKGTAQYREAENYLKGLYIVVTMLQTPSMTSLLSGVENRQDTTVSDLLRFMHSSNLRFGVAQDQQIEIYSELFGILNDLRTQVVGVTVAAADPPKADKKRGNPSQLFSGMEKVDFTKLEDELKKLLPPPPPEELKQLLPPPPGGNRRQPPPFPFPR